jgi:hypothetical protein
MWRAFARGLADGLAVAAAAFGGQAKRPEIPGAGEAARIDREAQASDWRAVGADMRAAVRRARRGD